MKLRLYLLLFCATHILVAQNTATIQSPQAGTQLPGTMVTFIWTGISGADYYWLDVGTAVAQGNICGLTVSATQYACSGIPVQSNYPTIYVQLWTHINGAWQTPNQYTYTAPAGASSTAQIQSPLASQPLAGTTVTFTWNSIVGADLPQSGCGLKRCYSPHRPAAYYPE